MSVAFNRRRADIIALLVLLCITTACGDASRESSAGADTVRGGPVIEDITAARPGSEADADIGGRAPDFELITLSGEPFHLGAHRGEVVLLNFWATWCAPCLVEIPDFIELQEELGDRGLQIVGIAVDAEGEEVVRPFAEEMGITYPIVVDIGEISEMYGGIYALPTSILIDRQGNIVQKIPGMLTRDRLRPILDELLSAS